MKVPILPPSRKQEFFHDLYSFLGEEKPSVNEESYRTSFLERDSSERLSEDSPLQIVQFDGCGDTSTQNYSEKPNYTNRESLEDSILLLPDQKRSFQATQGGTFHLVPGELLDDSIAEEQETTLSAIEDDLLCIELEDYYDLDLVTGDYSCCKDSKKTLAIDIEQPMLYFCLQVVDEYIITERLCDRMHWMVEACVTARCVLSSLWENLQATGIESGVKDICLQDYLARNAELPGVAHDVWRLIKSKVDYPDKVGDFRSDAKVVKNTKFLMERSSSCTWKLLDLLGIFGMSKSRARYILQGGESGSTVQCVARIKLMYEASKTSSLDALRFGIHYLEYVNKHDGTEPTNRLSVRHLMSRLDWKTAFEAILIHLQKWCPKVQMFPCGSFSRRAVMGSVVDILVKVPDDKVSTSSQCKDVVQALIAANVVEDGNVHYLTDFRALGIIHFKERILILDIKVAASPRCWFALTYYTGPACFVTRVFGKLLQHSLKGVRDTSFDALNNELNQLYGADRLKGIESEEDVFNLIDWKYLAPLLRG